MDPPRKKKMSKKTLNQKQFVTTTSQLKQRLNMEVAQILPPKTFEKNWEAKAGSQTQIQPVKKRKLPEFCKDNTSSVDKKRKISNSQIEDIFRDMKFSVPLISALPKTPPKKVQSPDRKRKLLKPIDILNDKTNVPVPLISALPKTPPKKVQSPDRKRKLPKPIDILNDKTNVPCPPPSHNDLKIRYANSFGTKENLNKRLDKKLFHNSNSHSFSVGDILKQMSSSSNNQKTVPVHQRVCRWRIQETKTKVVVEFPHSPVKIQPNEEQRKKFACLDEIMLQYLKD